MCVCEENLGAGIVCFVGENTASHKQNKFCNLGTADGHCYLIA